MTNPHDRLATIAYKVDALLRNYKHPNGRRMTYEDIERKTGVTASTISRIRNGENADPFFTTVIGLADAFEVPLSFFSTRMTESQVDEYVTDTKNVGVIEALIEAQQQEMQKQQNETLQKIAFRASHLDEAGIRAIAGMIDYVLKLRGIELKDDDKPSSSDV